MITIPIIWLVGWILGWVVSLVIFDFLADGEGECMTFITPVALLASWPVWFLILIIKKLGSPPRP